MNHTTWTHLLARALVRPLIGTGVTPSHLTTARLATGILACLLFATGPGAGFLWGGILWLISTFLDRADGELARIGDMKSEAGHRYDYFADNFTMALFFIAIGIGLRHSFLHDWSIPLGLLTGVSLFQCNRWSEQLEGANGFTERAYSGRWGFDLDDLLYLMAPIAWLGWLAPTLIGATVVACTFATITLMRVRRLPQRA